VGRRSSHAGRLGGRIVLQRLQGDPSADLEAAWQAGAGGVILVLSASANPDQRSLYLPSLEEATFPVVQITNDAFVNLVKASGHRMADLSTEKPVLSLGFRARLSVPLQVEPAQPTCNVLGLLPGSDPRLRDELLIVGAHYDHVGTLPDGTIYPGANDDASGVGAVLELARLFANRDDRPRRSILFAFWGAEEMGLLGSRHYVSHPALPLTRTIAMLQLDMIGQGRGYYLNLHADRAEAGEVLAALECAAGQVEGRVSGAGRSMNSDHAPFLENGVASVLLMWREGQEVHLPTDTPDLLDAHKFRVTGTVVAAALSFLADEG
ncbi:MAG: M20/M25/M40 family metallo-hydrolase, partial [Anaerolineae bacterium]|nr:M20/M25/M40 family metallo-hydrolase [Anaerolineae bacterium]